MTYPATQTHWLEVTDRCRIGLRRYSSRVHDGNQWTCETGWHEAAVTTGEAPTVYNDVDSHGWQSITSPVPDTPHDNVNWPAYCDKGCGYEFTPDDRWQDNYDQVWRRTDGSATGVLRDAAPGACWDAWWMPDIWRRPDGISLMVRCPNGHDWFVDGEASNCTRKCEPHACWVRHGDPRLCQVTVDKNGDTCAAGAGSIVAGDYHGFLQGGILTAG